MPTRPYPGFENHTGGSARAFEARLNRLGWHFGEPMSEKINQLPEEIQPVIRQLVQQAEEGL